MVHLVMVFTCLVDGAWLKSLAWSLDYKANRLDFGIHLR